MSLFLTWRCYNLHHSVRKISDHAMITFTLHPPFQYKTLTLIRVIKLLVWEHCRSRLRARAWSKQELRSPVISDCPGPRELPPSPYVSLFVPRLVPLLGGQTSCRHKWGQVTRMPPPPYPPRHQPTYPHPDQISWNKYTSL